jgi:hypothetical protein
MNRLIDSAGDARFGIFAEPIDEVNYADFEFLSPFGKRVGGLRRRFAFNQFQFLGALSEQIVFGCAMADIKYVGTAFIYCYEPTTRRFAEYSFQQPLARGMRFDQLPETGTSVFNAAGNRIEMTAGAQPRQRRLVVELRSGVAIDAIFSEEDPPLHPMFICTPAGATGWVYARKTAGHALSGTLRWEGRTFDLATCGARGHHDWSAGYMRRHTSWNWGCLAGRAVDGRILGMNVSCGVNETSFTENCFWVDGQLHKLDTVFFAYDRRDLMRPWRITSFDGRLQLAFRPAGRHSENINAWIVASNFNQLVGRYDGCFETAAGERIAISDMLGYAERHYAKW